MGKFFLLVYIILNIALIAVVFYVLDRFFGIKVMDKIKEGFYKIPKSKETVEKLKPIFSKISLPDLKAVFNNIKPKPKPINAKNSTIDVKKDISEYMNNKPKESIITNKTQSEHPGFGKIGLDVSNFNRGTFESDTLQRNSSNMEDEQIIAIRREAMRKEAEKREAMQREAEQREALKREVLRKEAEKREALKREALLKEAEQKEAIKREELQKEAIQREALIKETKRKETEQREALRLETQQREVLHREREILHRETAERESLQTVYGLASGDDSSLKNSRYIVTDNPSDSRISSSMNFISENKSDDRIDGRSDDGNNRLIHNYNKNEIYGNESHFNGLSYYDDDSHNDNSFNRNNRVLVSGLRLDNEPKKPAIKEIFNSNSAKRSANINESAKRGKKASKIASTGFASLFFNNSNGVVIIPYAKDLDGKGRAMDGIISMQYPFQNEEFAYALSSTVDIDKQTDVFTDKELVKKLGTKEWKEFTAGKRYISVRYEEDCGLIFNTTSRNPDGSYRLNCPGGIEKIVNMDTPIDELEEIVMSLLEKCKT